MATVHNSCQNSSQPFKSETLISLTLPLMEHNNFRKTESSSSLDHPLSTSVDSGVSVETIAIETAPCSERTASVLSTDSCPARLQTNVSGLMDYPDRSQSTDWASKGSGCPGTAATCPGSAPGSLMTHPTSTSVRPGSALARGVQIVEYRDAAIRQLNPEPIASVNEESLVLMEEYLSQRKLRALTGIDDLEKVEFLEMRVDTCDTSLGNFGMHLPNLQQLKLSNSIIASVRDLGSSLSNVRVLWMARCSTNDLDGVASLCNLQELYVAYNDIVDISPCSLLENIQVIDLEGNNIDDISQVEFLALCNTLTCLTLEGNPVCMKPSPINSDSDYDYRGAVKRALPQLQLLDDEPLLDDDQHSSRPVSAFDEDWKLIEELVQEGMMLPADKVDDMPGRPCTAWVHSIPYRPGSALKPPPTALSRPGTSVLGSSPRRGSAPGTADSGRPSTSSRTRSANSAAADDDVDVTCELTTGAVVCGNVSRALKSRKRDNSENIARKAEKYLAQFQFKAKPTGCDMEIEDDEKMKSILDELQQWKQQHQIRLKQVEASRAPQILTISYAEDAGNISSNSQVSDSDDDDMTDDEIAACSEAVLLPLLDTAAAAGIGQQPLLPSIESAGVTRRPDVAKEDEFLRKVKSTHISQTVFVSETSPSASPEFSGTGSVSVTPLLKRHSASSMHRYKSLAGSGGGASIDGQVVCPPGDYPRPVSGPVCTGRHKFKLEPMTSKSQPKIIDPKRSIHRGLTAMPEVLPGVGPTAAVDDLSQHRTGTLHVSAGDSVSLPLTTNSPPVNSSLVTATGNIRRNGPLSAVQLLPSKFK